MSNEVLTDEKISSLNNVISKYRNKKGSLISVLNESQNIFGYIPLEAQKKISEGLNIPLSEIYGVSTFYSAKVFLQVIVKDACGKCPPCRVGTKRMLEILEQITDGNGKPEYIDNLKELAKNVKSSSMCAIGQTAPNPVLAALSSFESEYLANVNVVNYHIDTFQEIYKYYIIDTCKGCALCKKACPADAILGEKKQLHKINQNRCIKCGDCIVKCPFKAIIKE